MATTGTDTPDSASLLTLLGPQLTAEQATLIFQQGQEAVVFALLNLAKQLAEKRISTSTTVDLSTPSGQTPPYAKPPAKGRVKARGARQGHSGRRRPAPTRIDRRETHSLETCPQCHGPVRRCRSARTRIIDDIPADITPVVTEHPIHRSWCPHCRTTVEPDCTRRFARLHDRPAGRGPLGVAALLVGHHAGADHQCVKLPPPAQAVLRRPDPDVAAIAGNPSAWYTQIEIQALNRAVLHADETGWRVNGAT